MSSFKPIDDRQVVNRAALGNIGSPANDTLDDIFSRIDSIIGSFTNSTTYIANKIALTQGTTSFSLFFPQRPDLSYVAMAMLENDTDTNPMYQQVEITSKNTTGIVFKWNAPLETANYFLNFILMPPWVSGAEASINSGVSTVSPSLGVPQNGTAYSIVGTMQNSVDSIVQFQTPLVVGQSSSGFTENFNSPTFTGNYKLSYIQNPTAQIAIPNGATGITVTLPVSYGSNGYAIIASMSNISDPNPHIQPLIVTAKNSSTFTVSWNTATESGNYLLNYYAISLTS